MYLASALNLESCDCQLPPASCRLLQSKFALTWGIDITSTANTFNPFINIIGASEEKAARGKGQPFCLVRLVSDYTVHFGVHYSSFDVRS
jgi:hypothetical protein